MFNLSKRKQTEQQRILEDPVLLSRVLFALEHSFEMSQLASEGYTRSEAETFIRLTESGFSELEAEELVKEVL